MTITVDKARWYEDGDGFWLAFRTGDRVASAKLAQELDKPSTIDIRKARKARSLDANAYLWVLLDRLAAVLRTTKEELYRFYILRVGAFKDFHLLAEEAPTFQEGWSRLGTGWITEAVDYAPDRESLVIRAYYGSSTYNTKRMSRLIDAVVGDCENQGLETKTPDELALMMARWGDAQAH